MLPTELEQLHKTDLQTLTPETEDRRKMVLSDGREIHIKPIKMKHVSRWSAYFIKMASLQAKEDGTLGDTITMTPESLVKMADLVPELGDRFNELVDHCLVGATTDDILQDDAFDVIERFGEVNLTETFMGKAMARALVRG